jgi:hypothetical protein
MLVLLVGLIAGYAVVTSMREVGSEKSRKAEYSSGLSRAAETMNQKLPRMLDSDTRLDKVSADSGRMNYFICLPNQAKAELDLPVLQEKLRRNIVANYKTNSAMVLERWNNAVLIYQYKDKNGELLFEISVSPKDF